MRRLAIASLVAVGVALAAACGSSSSAPSPNVTVTFRLDANCQGKVSAADMKVDGTIVSRLTPGQTFQATVAKGNHTLGAVSSDGRFTWGPFNVNLTADNTSDNDQHYFCT